MTVDELPQWILSKILKLDGQFLAAQRHVETLEQRVEHGRDMLNGRVQRPPGTDVKQIEQDISASFTQLQKLKPALREEAQAQREVKRWLDQLAPGTLLRPMEIKVAPNQTLGSVRTSIDRMRAEIHTLQQVPVPSPDIHERVQQYVRGMTGSLQVNGINTGERLAVIFPGADIGLNGPREFNGNPLACLAAMFPDQMTAWIMAHVEFVANQPMPPEQRAARIDQLNQAIIGATFVEEALVMAAWEAGEQMSRRTPVLPEAVLMCSVVTAADEVAA